MENLTKCEQLVMKAIWDAEDELGLMDVVGTVNSRFRKKWKPQTVSTFLSRLIKKGYLHSYRKGRVFYYQVRIPEDKYRAKLTDDFLSFWDHGNADEFICSLMQARPLRPDEVDRISRFIAEMKPIEKESPHSINDVRE